MLRTVVLHGALAKGVDPIIEVHGNTVAEIIELISRQVSTFAPHPIKGKTRIKVVGYETYESLYEPLTDDHETEIHIVPQFNGGKDSSGFFQIVIGLALVAAAFAIPGGIAGFWGSMALKMGALMVLGGLAQLLSPQPETDKGDDKKNNYLGAPTNTVAIGTRIPILYGEDRVYGHYISFDINAQAQTTT